MEVMPEAKSPHGLCQPVFRWLHLCSAPTFPHGREKTHPQRKKASERAPSSPQAYSGDGDYANTVCAWWGSDQTRHCLFL